MPPAETPLHEWSAVDALDAMSRGVLTAARYAHALLERVDAAEARVQAWAWLDRDRLMVQAREADRLRAAGAAATPLLGMPVALKDIIDVHGVPTELGTVLHAGRIGPRDATLVHRLRAAGAIPMGKTVTTELATYAPGKTRNPHDPARTPGGSSSGSAAAVAAGMVALSVGTQTNGSVIRPASFCGVVGFKPTFGCIGRGGVLVQSPLLDHVGVFARTVDDAALLAQAMVGPDEGDAHSGHAPMSVQWAARTPAGRHASPPRVGICRTPFWSRVEPDARAAFEAWAAVLGAEAQPIDLPAEAEEAVSWHRAMMEADLAGSFESEYERGRDRLSDSLRGQIERGRAVTAVEYRRAAERASRLAGELDRLFDTVDVLATPAALGVAPAGLSSTGDPLMSTLWSLCGQPALTLPLLRAAHGLPLGVQLVGRRHGDARLLRAARWLEAAAPASR
jgi:Asp-tRNA(Asn)/Glu-tRNA(Gln) amidotransferase A subunit family amidase